MSSIPHLAYDSPCSAIPLEDIQKALTQARRLARHQWRHDQHSVDLAEYEDVAVEALSRCLERFEPSKARFTPTVRTAYAAPCSTPKPPICAGVPCHRPLL